MSRSLLLVAILFLAAIASTAVSPFSPTLPTSDHPRTSPQTIPPPALDSLLASTHYANSNPGRAANPLTVLAFLSTECPLSRNQVLTLNRLLSTDRRVTVIGLIPRLGIDDSARNAITDFRTETDARFPLVGDPDVMWVNRLGATITPEVFLIDSTGTVVYSGAVDDWMVTLGRKRPAPRQHYLRDAIEAVRTQSPVAISYVPAVGCRIE